MPNTSEGAKRAAETLKRRYGADYYTRLARMGGKRRVRKGFGSLKVGSDGLTGPERAVIHGARGGMNRWRGKHE